MSTDTTQQQTTPHERPLRREGLVFEEVDGEAVLYDPGCRAVHRFDALTLLVWNACDGLHSAADITREVIAAYDVDSNQALDHVEQLITELRARDLLANSRSTSADNPEGADEGTTVARAPEPTAETSAVRQSDDWAGPGRRSSSPSGLFSRRTVLRGGVKKLAFAAPVIATFFTRPAYASNPIHPLLSAFGAGGCKNPGYSCAVNPDCCGYETESAACQDTVCCIKHNRSGCSCDQDCCDFPADACNAGTCE